MVIGLIVHSWRQLDLSNHVYPHLAISILDNLSVAIRRFILYSTFHTKFFLSFLMNSDSPNGNFQLMECKRKLYRIEYIGIFRENVFESSS